MSDKEIIIRSLETVERRIRTNHLLRELTLAFSVFLLIPIAFKTWDLFRPFRGLTVSLVLAVWFAGVFAYVAWRISHRSTLAHTAAAIDRKARLRDELKSAYWFATHPAGVLRGDWVELQVRRAALRATQLNVDQLYPRVIPTTSYMAIGLIVLLVGLNFLPLSTNHNWFYLEAAPAFTLTSEELRLIDQTKQLLKQAEQLEQPELVKQLEEIVQNLQEGNIDPAEALRQLEELKNMLGEGNLDVAALNEGLDEMANDLSGSPETSDVSKAMSEHDLEESAEELRKLAAELKNSDDAAAMQAVQNALQQASENSSAGMQKLAEDMKNAADGLAAKDSQAVQDA